MQVLLPSLDPNRPELQQLLTSPELGRLLLVNTACVAQRLYKQLGGKSVVSAPQPAVLFDGSSTSSDSSNKGEQTKGRSGSKQQQHFLVPVHHRSMLEALGLKALDTQKLSSDSSGAANVAPGDNEHNSLVVNVAAAHCALNQRMSASSASSGVFSTGGRRGFASVPGLTGAGLAAPLLLLLAEGLMLAPDVEHCVAALRFMQIAMQGYHTELDAAGQYSAMDTTTGDVKAAEVIAPVLQLVVPAALYVLAESREFRRPDIMTAGPEMKAEIVHELGMLVMYAMIPSECRGQAVCRLSWVPNHCPARQSVLQPQHTTPSTKQH